MQFMQRHRFSVYKRVRELYILDYIHYLLLLWSTFLQQELVLIHKAVLDFRVSNFQKVLKFQISSILFFLMCVGKLLPRRNCFNNSHANFCINYYKKSKNIHFYDLSEQTPIIAINQK